MRNFTQKTRILFLGLTCTATLFAASFSPLACATPNLATQAMIQQKITDTERESLELKQKSEAEQKLYDRYQYDDEAQIHCAYVRTYQRIIKLNKEKIKVWKGLLSLEQER
jgi:hypothetical protein